MVGKTCIYFTSVDRSGTSHFKAFKWLVIIEEREKSVFRFLELLCLIQFSL